MSRTGQTRYPPELLESYHRLVTRKLSGVLSEEEASELAAICERIDEIDRSSPGWKRMEEQIRVVDKELADIRRFIESHPRKRRESP
jgi:hypothetical protein